LKKILFVCFIFSITLFAKTSTLNLNKLDEISILNSLNINASFMNDPKYKSMKNNINELKTIYFLKALKKGSIFMPNLHELLDEADIPDTFLYMAMVESKFRANVKSNRNAAGLWQIMPSTAKQFNLEVNRNIDERLDPIKSTKAAIKYLQYLHDRFGKWYLAAIAYNCGETKLARVLKKAGTDDLAVLIDDKKKYLPAESRNYIRRIIIAALLAHDEEIIVKNNADHLFGNCTNSKLIEVFFNGGMSLKSIANKVGMSLKKIRTCNPHLLRSKLPANKKTYHIYLPQELIADLENKTDDKKISIGRFTYTIKKGDTLSKISKKYNNKISAIKRLNPHLKKSLRIGQKITLIGQSIQEETKLNKKSKKKAKIKPLDIDKLPLATTIPLSPLLNSNELNKSTKPASKNKILTYIIKKEDSPASISKKFNIDIPDIEKLNPDFQKNFKDGMIIKIKH
jgi:membrane-bound lytic murein transglycosylase D